MEKNGTHADSARRQRGEDMAEDFEIQDGILIRYHGCGTEVVIPDRVQEIG